MLRLCGDVSMLNSVCENLVGGEINQFDLLRQVSSERMTVAVVFGDVEI